VSLVAGRRQAKGKEIVETLAFCVANASLLIDLCRYCTTARLVANLRSHKQSAVRAHHEKTTNVKQRTNLCPMECLSIFRQLFTHSVSISLMRASNSHLGVHLPGR
jgi:hypothetical protein